MRSPLYFISAILFAVVLGIILFNELLIKGKANLLEKRYRILLIWVIAFCVQDVVWGLCDSGVLVNDVIFYISSVFFHTSSVITSLFWLNYVLTYLDISKRRKCYLLANLLVVIFQIVLIVINFFTPIIFRIENHIYVTYSLRWVTFLNQFIVYFTISIGALCHSILSKEKCHSKFFTVFIFTLGPIVCGILQLLYTSAPFYSMGYFLGCFIIHVFIVAKDRTELREGALIKSLTNIYSTMYLIDLEEDTIEPYITKDDVIEYKTNNAMTVIMDMLSNKVDINYLADTLEFVNTETIKERIKNKKTISIECKFSDTGWNRLVFIPIDENSEHDIIRVMLAIENINEEKCKQDVLLIKSNTDELTGLYNRRAYEDDSLKILDDVDAENFIYISMDVNNLKKANDTLGHAAGDELIEGAAAVLKDVFAGYGNSYRIGGDEFVSFIFASESDFEKLMERLNKTIDDWRGELVNSLSLSCGFVTRREAPDSTIVEIAKMADSRMYKDKAQYYIKNNIDRRKR